jgi:hypothetical protein
MVFSNNYGVRPRCRLEAFAQSFAAKFDWFGDKMRTSG